MSVTITIRKPAGLCEKGKRANNEDSVYPSLDKRNLNHHLFMVCDGVGGATKGEIASKLACETFSSLFQKTVYSDPPFIDSVLKIVEDGFQEYIEDNPSATGMATTLTLLHFHGNGATVAHIGDSRIYHIRNGKILYRSEDHSFVQELVKAGIISPEEARSHPKRNVISRAIQGKQNRTNADTFILQDIQAGDFFFLCSDGILESVTEHDLCGLLISPISNSQKIAQIKKMCVANSRDNFSCYLIEIANCSGNVDEEFESPKPSPSQIETTQSPSAGPSITEDRPTSLIEVAGRGDGITLITPPQSSRFKETITTPSVIKQEEAQKKERLHAGQGNNYSWLIIALPIGLLIAGLFYYFFINK
jgi:serine/threonine protein phosphatase PrpC